MPRLVLIRAAMLVAVLGVLWALWEAFKAVAEATGLRLGAFVVDDSTFPHLHDIVAQLFEPSRRNGPLLIEVLWDAALFTAKEAFVGFVLGATVGFVIGVILVHSNLLQRGFLPYIVASQTVPILARSSSCAPMRRARGRSSGSCACPPPCRTSSPPSRSRRPRASWARSSA